MSSGEKKAPGEQKRGTATAALKDPLAICGFEPTIEAEASYGSHQEKAVKPALERHLQRKIAKLSLARPAISGDFCVLGTDDPHGEEDHTDHFLACVNWRNGGQPGHPFVRSVLEIKDVVRDVHWVTGDLVLAATGDGDVRVIQVGADKLIEQARFEIHRESIREMALNRSHHGQFVSGGFDKRVCIVDISVPKRILAETKCESIVGSVRWPFEHNQNVCVSATLDMGKCCIWDIRQPFTVPSWQCTLGKPDAYAHERYSDHHVIVGFGDGEMQHLDVRVTDRILHKVQDPFVEGIGHIQYNQAASTFVVSGFTDFTVWKHNTTTGLARPFCHSVSHEGAISSSSGLSTFAVYGNANTLLATNSAGYVCVYDF